MLKSFETIHGRLSNLWPWKNRVPDAAENVPSASQEERLNRAIGPYETMVFKIQSLLIWENPVMSTIFVIGVNLLFWLVTTLEFRFYSLACLTLLILFVYNLWVEEIWPEIRVPPQDPPDSEDWTPIHPSVLSVPEISHYLSQTRAIVADMVCKAKLMREEQPGLFCGTCCCVLTLLIVVGRAVSGAVLLYIVTMVLLLLPGVCLHLLPHNTRAKVAEVKEKVNEVKDFFFPQPTGENSGDAEYLPEETPEMLALLSLTTPVEGEDDELASLLPGEIPDGADSCTTTHNSLTPGLSLMPSHDEESVDGLESLLDLEPPQRPPDQDGIRFRTRHFNDSSEEEDSLSRGLQFSDAAPDAPRPEPVTLAGPFADLLARAALENMAKSLVDAVSSVAQSVVTREAAPAPAVPRPLADDDSDEDFEMINEDELPSIS